MIRMFITCVSGFFNDLFFMICTMANQKGTFHLMHPRYVNEVRQCTPYIGGGVWGRLPVAAVSTS
jgi:hypothetical protein